LIDWAGASRSDLRLLRRAIREWPVEPDEKRRALVNIICRIGLIGPPRHDIAAFWCALDADRANKRQP
jgi:hypothetical protein